MTRTRYLQIKIDLAKIRQLHRTPGILGKPFLMPSLEQTDVALIDLESAWGAERMCLAKRSATTRKELKKFAPTPQPWRGYFLLESR